jgi:peroxiredoxin
VLAISSDERDTLVKFRAKYGKDVAFVSDPEGELIERYGVKTPVLTFAQRTTFIIDQAGVIRAVQTGGDAIDVKNALQAVKSLK